MDVQTCVIVSYWAGRSSRLLHHLLRQMLKFEAGAPFDLLIVCNGGDEKPLTLTAAFDKLRPQIINRANRGYNIGAWDAGWRSANEYKYFLFLQDECFLKKSNWLFDFIFRMESDAGIGLLGEAIMWDRMTWSFIRTSTDRDLGLDWFKGESLHPLDFYQNYLCRNNIPLGEVGAHLQSLILFTSKSVLEQIGGFPVGETYREAVACEIGVSRLVEAKGYRISKVKDSPFTLIGHQQWTRIDRFKRVLRQRLATMAKAILGRRRSSVR